MAAPRVLQVRANPRDRVGMKTHYGLRSKVTTAMTLAFVLVLLLVGYLLYVQDRIEYDHDFLNRINELNTVAEFKQEKARLYLQQRSDQDSECNLSELVWRDAFQKDLGQIDSAINALDLAGHLNGVSQFVHDQLFRAEDDLFEQAVADLKRRFTLFANGFKSSLGSNPACPRVQEAAAYILKDERRLFAEIPEQLSLLSKETRMQKAFLDQFTLIALGIALLSGLLGLLWFQFKVMRRIGKTVAGCREVATGGFGYQIELDPQHDELSSVVEAFNAMSTRTHLVLSVLDAMQDAGDRRESLKVIWEESQPYLGTEWMGLIAFNRDDQSVVRHSLPPIVYEPLRRARIPRTQSGFESMLHTRNPLKVDDLVEFANLAANTSRDRFMRLMAERTDLRSMIALPLHAEDGWQGVLVFANTEENHFNDEQVVLMGNLAQMIANGLSKGSERGR